MLDNPGSTSLGNIQVQTQEYRGHPPEFWAEQATNRICGISENAAPHIRQQAEEYRLAIYTTILYYIREGIKSERCTIVNLLNSQGHEDLAKIFKELK
jgi:hypothetical protein|tara:strand:+ start:506 stop:799 length:294 start_codon:yes stop_codon:yes gene_type:complete